ncbi:MAG: hypothetical protein GXY07_09155 [Candidatus Hydrogenedentes bacterium]|nr:hypothetical protein [Candidatus Hydrogenedentota bacterium]
MKKLFLILLVVIVVNGMTAAAPAPTLDMLIADLKSGDDGPRQARARQLLPLRGPEVARDMTLLLDDPNPAVSFTALRVLEDVIHETALRGSAGDRDSVAASVFSLLAPGASDKQKDIGLRLLPYAIDEGHDLGAVAALLKEEAWREPARASLENLHNQKALLVLCDALNGADESFKVALLRSIALFPPDWQNPGVEALLTDPSAAVRGAGLRALARTGNPALISEARRICAQSGAEDAFDAWDGWLRLTDAMAARGGLWEQAMQSYREILETAPHTLIQGGAITGMVRYGDNSCIPVIEAALARDTGFVLEPAALEAFRNLDGREARLDLAAAYPRFSTTMKVGLLALFGDKAAPEYAPLLTEAAKDTDPAIRSAARAALGRGAFPEAAPIFEDILKTAADTGAEWTPELDETLQSLQSLARQLRQAGNGEGAGRAWLAVYRHARDDAARAEALDGIRQHPVPEAFDVVLDLLKAGDIESLPVEAMIGIAQNAMQAGREEEGRKLMDEIVPKLATPEAVRGAVGAMRGRGPNPEFARAIGVVNHWQFVGPFPWNISEGFKPVFINEPEVSLDASYPAGDKTLQWHAADSTDAAGLYDLFGVIGTVEQSVAFAFVQIEVAEGGPAQLRAGSDDGLRVWVNGEVALENDVDRGYDVDQDVADITLRPGTNTLLAQITQRAGGWAFGLRITRPDGTPYPFTIVP